MNGKSRLSFLPFAALAFGLSTLSSCDSDFEPDITKTSDLSGQNVTDVKTVGESEAQESFAKILSVAASKDAALRQFLKAEAEKQFDKDYDVFYPYVKDAVVEDGRTFRDVLLSYTSEEELSTLENSLPLLTIMIPDLSAFGAFSVYKWDPKDEQVAVTYAKGNDSSVFYSEGDSILSLPAGSLPSFPFLVVKSNERMKVVGTGTTRAGQGVSYQYDFVDPAFDGSKTVHTRASYYDEKNPEAAPEDKPYLRKSVIDRRCVDAYNFSKQNRKLIDREYIYYNLSPKNPTGGQLEPNVREKIYMFRISPAEYNRLIDKEAGQDPHLEEYEFYKTWHPSLAQIAKDLWTDGAFEIIIQSYKGATGFAEVKPISVKGSDLFYVDKFHVRYKHATGFRHAKWWYSVTPDDLRGKWVDLSDKNLYLTDTWDLLNSPVDVFIKILEKDDGVLKTVSESYTTSYVAKAELGAGVNIGDEWKINLGFSGQLSGQKSYTVSYQYKDENDDLGSIVLNFKDPVILSDKDVATKGYQMHSLSTGTIDLVIAPKSLR